MGFLKSFPRLCRPKSQRSLKRGSTGASLDGTHPTPTFMSSLMETVKLSPINALLVFLPLGLIAGQMEWNDTLVFAFNFLAIIPLAKLLGFATEEISIRTGPTIGGLLNATIGNSVELLVGLAALREGLVRVVQMELLGSILSNLLLVLGLCFTLGGFKYSIQTFSEFSANTSASLLTITTFSVVIPAAFKAQLESSQVMESTILALSRGSALILLCIYLGYLVFQLKTHAAYFEDDSQEEDGQEPEFMIVTLPFAIVLLGLVTVSVGFCSDYLVGSIEGLSDSWNLSKNFIGFVLLPFVGSAAELASSISFAMKNKMSLSISIAIGSSMQVGLFIIPVLVLTGWILNVPMTLAFTIFEVGLVVMTVLMVNGLIRDGNSNWFEGILLLGCYSVMSVAYIVMPEETDLLNL